jgi:enoyl-CoA hydratase
MAKQWETLLYATDGPVATITMNRPEARNAQNQRMTYDLDEAFNTAAADGDVKVIVLAGTDPHFSSGHDLRGAGGDPRQVSMWYADGKVAAEAHLAREEEIYLQMCRRWRDIPKVTIAAVQGKCIAGGLMLAWVCDLIVCSEDAQFSDPVLRMGICGVEWFGHPWEFGARKAKEMLFTGEFIDAQEAYRLGMVNRVVPRERLMDETMTLAKKIGEMPSVALTLTKQAVNQTLDAMGQWTAMQSVFNLHQLAHSHAAEVTGGTRILTNLLQNRASG